MAIGLPNTIENLSRFFPHLPDTLVTAISGCYQSYSDNYINFITWCQFGRHYDSRIEPLDLYSIAPTDITYIPSRKAGTTWECSVKSGDWDKDLEEFTNTSVRYRSFQERFENGVDWKDTELYFTAIGTVRSGENWKTCESEEEILDRLHSYDELYDQIKKEGYKTQRQLRSETSTTDPLRDKHHHPPEFSEITIDVGREGELIWYSGIHRLSIARILGLDSVPVRIRVRHKQWQEYRDEVWNDPSKDASWHPDLHQPD